jgi:hypothetical protein
LTMLITVVGAGVFLLPRAAAADTPTLSAPTGLHQSGVDAEGYPIIDWDRSADHTPGQTDGYYYIHYDPIIPAGYPTTGSGFPPDWHTGDDIWGYCIASGTYDVSVQFKRSDGALSGRSNAIRLVLNTPFRSGPARATNIIVRQEQSRSCTAPGRRHGEPCPPPGHCRRTSCVASSDGALAHHQQPLLRRTHMTRLTVGAHLDRAQDANLHRTSPGMSFMATGAMTCTRPPTMTTRPWPHRSPRYARTNGSNHCGST